MVDFDYLPVGESGPPGAQGLSEDASLRYILAIMDDLKNFMSLKAVAVCTDDITAAICAHLMPDLGGAKKESGALQATD